MELNKKRVCNAYLADITAMGTIEIPGPISQVRSITGDNNTEQGLGLL